MTLVSLLFSCSLFFVPHLLDAQSPWALGGSIGIEFSNFFQDVKVNAVGGCAFNSKKNGGIIFGGMIQHDKGVHTPSFVCGVRPHLPSIYLDSTAIGIAFNQNQAHATALPWPNDNFKEKSKIDSALALAWAPAFNTVIANARKEYEKIYQLRALVAQQKKKLVEYDYTRDITTVVRDANNFIRFSKLGHFDSQTQEKLARVYYTRLLEVQKNNSNDKQYTQTLEKTIDTIKTLFSLEEIV